MSLLLTFSDDRNKNITFRAAAVLAVATDVRMYVISNNEVK